MEAALFTKMLSGQKCTGFEKLGYKFPQADIGEFVGLLKTASTIPCHSRIFPQDVVYLPSIAQVHLSAAKVLLTPQNSMQLYGVKAMEEEIASTFTIEQVDFYLDSVRKILSGLAPADENESRIFGMKRVEFISDLGNQITDASIHRLYEMAIGAYLLRKTVCFPASSTGTIVYMLSAQRWSMLVCPGRSCQHIWRSWSLLSTKTRRSTIC